MAGIGIGPREFAVLETAGPEECQRLVAAVLLPRLEALGGELAGALTRVMGRRLVPQVGTSARRRGAAPGEAFVAFHDASSPRGAPFAALAVSRNHLHARVGARGTGTGLRAMRRTVEREAGTLARRGKPFRRLRSYAGWDHEELPELAPAASPAFWREVAEGLAPGDGQAGVADLGIAWPREEARGLALGDLLGAYRDLSPIFKLLAAAGEAGAATPAPRAGAARRPARAAASPRARPAGPRR
jgi:hypothetical protein